MLLYPKPNTLIVDIRLQRTILRSGSSFVYALRSLFFQCLIESLFTTDLLDLYILVLALETPGHRLSGENIADKSAFAISFQESGAVKLGGTFYNCANVRELGRFHFPVILPIMPLGI